jgi:hypothetical protein
VELERLLVPLSAAFLLLVPVTVPLFLPSLTPFISLVPLPALFRGTSALEGKDLGFETVLF